jgi:hypothetical protein
MKKSLEGMPVLSERMYERVASCLQRRRRLAIVEAISDDCAARSEISGLTLLDARC